MERMEMGVEEETRTCRTCRKVFQAPMARVMGHRFGPTLCPECAARHEDEEELRLERERQQDEVRQRWKEESGVHPNYWDATFESWEQRTRLQEPLAVCMDYADNFPVGRIPFRHRSLMLYSKESGRGKTHLASAVINRIIVRWDGDPEGARCPVRYETGPSLQLRVRRSYRPPPDPEVWQESEADIYEQLRGVPLLVLDDVGDPQKEAASDHSRRVYFHVIDQRYSDGLPVLLCSNVDMKGLERVMGAATVDRLREMVWGFAYGLEGEKSYREVIKERRKEHLRKDQQP